MQQKAQETTDYTIEREFLGDITAAELVKQIIRSHLFPPYVQKTTVSKEERKAWEYL